MGGRRKGGREGGRMERDLNFFGGVYFYKEFPIFKGHHILYSQKYWQGRDFNLTVRPVKIK